MKPLALSGKARQVQATGAGPDHRVIRLVDPGETDLGPADAVLCKPVKPSPVGGERAFAIIVGDETDPPEADVVVRLGDEFDYLRAGDILGLHLNTGRIRTLYRRNSRHNSFLTTERCNHYCLMCSQPPKNADDAWLLDEIAMALPLVDPATRSLGLTGGEPLLEWRRIVGLLAQARDTLPDTAMHVLTNGRGFAATEVADAWADVAHPNLCAGIPIYAAVDSIHDYVVQAPGAFDETLLGVLRLKERRQRVEIRVVLHSLTAPRIVETARWLARNLPFVDHVALMGLENTGFAIANHELLWMDPIEYRSMLSEAVDILDAARVPTSIYNLPYCVLDRRVWPFAAQSISDWKNAYLPQCERCAAKSRCAGFFSTGRPRQSRAIEPIATFDLG
jgi:His-Xaa-Ser system radical SAM maturase HxsC